MLSKQAFQGIPQKILKSFVTTFEQISIMFQIKRSTTTMPKNVARLQNGTQANLEFTTQLFQLKFAFQIDEVGYTFINVSWTPSSVPHLNSYCLKYTPAYLPNYDDSVLLPPNVLTYSLT